MFGCCFSSAPSLRVVKMIYNNFTPFCRFEWNKIWKSGKRKNGYKNLGVGEKKKKSMAQHKINVLCAKQHIQTHTHTHISGTWTLTKMKMANKIDWRLWTFRWFSPSRTTTIRNEWMKIFITVNYSCVYFCNGIKAEGIHRSCGLWNLWGPLKLTSMHTKFDIFPFPKQS